MAYGMAGKWYGKFGSSGRMFVGFSEALGMLLQKDGQAIERIQQPAWYVVVFQ